MLGIWLLCDNYFYCLDVKVGKQLADINARSRWIFTFFQASNEIKLKKMIPFYIIARVVPLVQMVTYMYRRKRQSFTEISNNPCRISSGYHSISIACLSMYISISKDLQPEGTVPYLESVPLLLQSIYLIKLWQIQTRAVAWQHSSPLCTLLPMFSH